MSTKPAKRVLVELRDELKDMTPEEIDRFAMHLNEVYSKKWLPQPPAKISDEINISAGIRLTADGSRRFSIESPLVVSRAEMDRIQGWINVMLIVQETEPATFPNKSLAAAGEGA